MAAPEWPRRAGVEPPPERTPRFTAGFSSGNHSEVGPRRGFRRSSAHGNRGCLGTFEPAAAGFGERRWKGRPSSVSELMSADLGPTASCLTFVKMRRITADLCLSTPCLSVAVLYARLRRHTESEGKGSGTLPAAGSAHCSLCCFWAKPSECSRVSGSSFSVLCNNNTSVPGSSCSTRCGAANVQRNKASKSFSCPLM